MLPECMFYKSKVILKILLPLFDKATLTSVKRSALSSRQKNILSTGSQAAHSFRAAGASLASPETERRTCTRVGGEASIGNWVKNLIL